MRLRFCFVITFAGLLIVLNPAFSLAEPKIEGNIPVKDEWRSRHDPLPVRSPQSTEKKSSVAQAEPAQAGLWENLPQIPFEEFDLKCTGQGASASKIIESQEEYQEMIDASPDLHPEPSLPCADYQFPEIDFSQSTLLGKPAYVTGCSAGYERKLFQDDANHKIIYQINVRYQGTCEMIISNSNWIRTPKLPPEYNVIFKVNKIFEEENKVRYYP